ncbi:DUF6920 family protein [Halorientalis salina]|uniref:DUF6920 family protein n=1 Tax=Halorientalis salina TaxID=2932266 RepID=UPI003558F92B
MLLSVLPVAESEPSPGMNEAELQRCLDESVWFPTTLRTLFLHSNNLLVPFGVAWVALGIFVHERRAR